MLYGASLLLAGVAFNLVGWFIKVKDLGLYGWAMIIGTLLFGVGFLLIFYSLMRKVEYQGIVEERAAEAEKSED
jgi:F0F1-type ATP synthase assembly protein I